MSPHSIVFCFTLLFGLPVEATKLDGNRQSGELTALTATTLVVQGGDGPVEIPVQDRQDVWMTAPVGTAAPVQVRSTDETLWAGGHISIWAGELRLASDGLGGLRLSGDKGPAAL